MRQHYLFIGIGEIIQAETIDLHHVEFIDQINEIFVFGFVADFDDYDELAVGLRLLLQHLTHFSSQRHGTFFFIQGELLG